MMLGYWGVGSLLRDILREADEKLRRQVKFEGKEGCG